MSIPLARHQVDRYGTHKLKRATSEKGKKHIARKGSAIEPNFSEPKDEQPFIHQQNRLRDRTQSTLIRVTSAATTPIIESVPNLAPPSVAPTLSIAPPPPRLSN
ncbi:hypothetical protein H5410_061463 [Solanum commersonii]|uniref:Uncharacterized protein n=1 Tax=Solanum commersonii TaxID=4109 RepID=A0A9J5W844_SOLCO|nr:hypothetical protein H5410_061463 [Solanum commersonii]